LNTIVVTTIQLSQCRMRNATRTGCALRIAYTWMWRKQAMTDHMQ